MQPSNTFFTPEARRRTLFVIALVFVTLIGLLVMRERSSSERRALDAPSASASVRPPRWAAAWRPVYLSGGQKRSVEASAVGAFEGHVVSSGSGRGVPNAELTFVGPGGAEATKSGEDGVFELRPAREGRYELSLVTAAGFLPFTSELGSSPIVVTAKRGSGISGMRFSLDPALEYTGHVVDPKGAAVSGAAVKIHDSDHFELSLASIPVSFVSDEKGEFKFSAPDGAIVEATKPGFAPARGRVDFSVQVSRHLKLRLIAEEPMASGSIRGRVVDESGAARADALVVARVDAENPASEAATMNPGARARTGAGGEFSLDGLSAGAYTVLASAAESAPAIARHVAVGGPPLTLVLTIGGTLRGRVTDKESGQPIVAFTVAVSERDGPIARHTVRVASAFDPDGRYTIDHLAPGTYSVTASAADFAPAADVDVTLGKEASADFALERGARLVGVVRDEKSRAPIDSAKVSLEGRLGGGPSSVPLLAVTLSAADGSFELRGIAPGERSVLAAASGHHGRLIGGIRVLGTETIGPVEILLAPTAPGEDPRIELVGIGAVLAAKDDALVIGKIVPGGGAAEVGLAIGDAILAVDGARVTVLGFETAIQKIRGPEGTNVTLLVRRAAGGEPVSLVVPRKRIKA